MALLFSSTTSVALASQPVTTNPISAPEPALTTVLKVQEPHKPNFDTDVLAPLRAAQKAEADRIAKEKSDEEAAQAAVDAANALAAAQAVEEVKPAYTAPVQVSWGGLTGQLGYASPYGNCVDLAKSYGKNQPGDPISWGISSRTPWIGAAALFYTNHVAIVVGIWGNGDVELAHANCPGCATRVSAGSLRGFF